MICPVPLQAGHVEAEDHLAQHRVHYFSYLAVALAGGTCLECYAFCPYKTVYFYFFLYAIGDLLQCKLKLDAKI